MSRICVDTGFLIALYNDRDELHHVAETHFVNYLDGTRHQLLAPWPILYETVKTRTVRNRPGMERLRRDWQRLDGEQRLVLVDDNPQREAGLEECFAELNRTRGTYRSLSLVDRVIRALIATTVPRIEYLLTFNDRDFEDVCRNHGCVLVSSA